MQVSPYRQYEPNPFGKVFFSVGFIRIDSVRGFLLALYSRRWRVFRDFSLGVYNLLATKPDSNPIPKRNSSSSFLPVWVVGFLPPAYGTFGYGVLMVKRGLDSL